MASPVSSRRWLQCFSRKYNQTRSTGLISGEYGGSQTSVTLLGISNVTARQIGELVELARIPPAFVQNRCYAERGWDRAIRALCGEHNIVYQAFSLLTANRDVTVHREVRAIATRHRKTPAQIIFRFARQAGMLPLTGTSSPAHMREDLAIDDFALDAQELATVDAAGER